MPHLLKPSTGSIELPVISSRPGNTSQAPTTPTPATNTSQAAARSPARITSPLTVDITAAWSAASPSAAANEAAPDSTAKTSTGAAPSGSHLASACNGLLYGLINTVIHCSLLTQTRQCPLRLLPSSHCSQLHRPARAHCHTLLMTTNAMPAFSLSLVPYLTSRDGAGAYDSLCVRLRRNYLQRQSLPTRSARVESTGAVQLRSASADVLNAQLSTFLHWPGAPLCLKSHSLPQNTASGTASVNAAITALINAAITYCESI